MSSGDSPPPGQPDWPPDGDSWAEFATPVDVAEAVRYIDTAAPHWILEPAAVTVGQPHDQTWQIDNFERMLASQEQGDTLAAMLQANLASMRSPDVDDTLLLKVGWPMDELDKRGLSRAQFEMHQRDATTTEEYIDQPDRLGLMLTGLQVITGAQVIRDDFADGNTAGRRLYKGMLDGEPVYLVEYIVPHEVPLEDGGVLPVYERSVLSESENSARTNLNALSGADTARLNALGIATPAAVAAGGALYPGLNRAAMIDLIHLLVAARGGAALGPRGDVPPVMIERIDSGETTAARQALLSQQQSRESQENMIIANLQMYGASEGQIAGYRADLARMRQAELWQGRTFPHWTGFRSFEALMTRPDTHLEPAAGSGFEQGDSVMAMPSAEATELGWIFLGADRRSGLAEIGRLDPITGQGAYRSYDFGVLRRLNGRGNV